MKIWAVVPAAGIGTRMQASIPKQYLRIQGQTVLSLTLARLSSLAAVERIILVLAANDRHWSLEHGSDGHAQFADPSNALVTGAQPEKVLTCTGGADRWQSVLNGLEALAELAAPDDWVLVHDAVRPCVRVDDILQLLDLTRQQVVGGLLALPVSDTLKKADGSGRVTQTVDRSSMWAACTPQLFRLQPLRQALHAAAAAGVTVTDEASAMEWAGEQPTLVPCHKDNIKITYAEDLQLAELILRAQQMAADSAETQAYTGILE